MIRLFLFLCFILVSLFGTGQTGPGGVGDTTGSSNLVLWLKADTGVEESAGDTAEMDDAIEFWRDQSGYGNDASQSVFADRPIFNGSAIRFTGASTSNLTGEYFSLAGIDAQTIIFVVENLGAGSSGSTNGIFGQMYSGSAVYFHTFSNDGGTTSNFSFDGTLSNTGRFARDGASLSGFEENHSGDALNGDSLLLFCEYNNPVSDFIYLGALDNSGSGAHFRATYDLKEMIVYDSLLNDCERKRVELYLNEKHNLDLQLDFFDESASGSNGIQSDIAGIYKSTTEQVEEASSGLVKLSNEAFLTDLADALFIAHNNGTGVTYNSLPVGIEVMQSRQVWADYSSCESNNGNVTVGIDLTSLPPASATAFRLITSDSPDFSSGTLFSGGSLSGDSVYFTLAATDLNDVYFCLGTTDNDVSRLTDLSGPEGINSGIRLWLMMDAGVEEADGVAAVAGDDVEYWRDQSGNGADATQTTSSARPRYNGDAIQFRGTANAASTGEYMDLPMISGQTVFAVIDNAADSTGNIQAVLGQNLGNSSIYLHLYTSGSIAYSFDGTTSITGRYSHSGAAYSGLAENVNGPLLPSDPTISLMEWNTGVEGLAYLAALDNNSGPQYRANYDIKEFIVYGNQLSNCERRKIEAYLGGKYSIFTENYTAPSAAFVNDTAVLLHQSSYANLSIDSSASLVVEDVSFLTETADRLTICHNNESSVSSDVPGSISLRLNRLWYADYFSCSANAGNVSLKFLISGTDCDLAPSQLAANYRLLHSASTTMSGATVVSGATVTGDTVEFTVDVSAIADRYFTLATTDIAASGLGIYAPEGIYEGITQWLKPGCGIEKAEGDDAESGDAVYRWKDQSGSENHATQETMADRPLYNGSAIVFSGEATSTTDGQYFEMPRFDGQTFIAVLEDIQTATGDAHGFVGQTPGANYTDIFLSSGGFGYPVSMDGTSSATGSMAIGGQELSGTATNVGSGDFPDSLSILFAQYSSPQSNWEYLGGIIRSGTSVHFRGNYKLRELIVYNRVLDCDERNSIENYLSDKYSISLESSLTETIGDNDISENIASVHTGNLSGISSALFIENVSLLNDCVDTVWIAHDTAIGFTPKADDPDMSGLAGDSVARWSRRWYALVKTNAADAGNVTVTFDLDDYGDTVTVDGVDYRLVTSASPWTYAPLVSGPTLDVVQNSVSFVVNASNLHKRFFTLGTRNISLSPLPIELLLFNAASEGDNVQLQWITATESNSDYFEVQRSENGKEFSNIGRVAAAGNSLSNRSYSFMDHSPYSPQGYYRLKSVDFDGQYAYSYIRTVNLAIVGQVNVYPNPTNGRVVLSSEFELSSSLLIMNALGQNVSDKVELHQVSPKELQLNLERMPPGVYTIRIGSLTHRLVKQ